MFCHNCGTQLREDAKFCHVCGAEQILEEYSNAAVSQPLPQEGIPAAQPLTGTFSWDNVKISGEFKNGTGSITITFN